MKIMVFLHGTTIMHKNAAGKSREEIIRQVEVQEESVRDFGSYIPVGNAVNKLKTWASQGAEIVYLSALTEDKRARADEVVGPEGLKADQEVLDKHGFPKGEIYHRQKGEHYARIVERVMPDVLIEDDCESIGGEVEMTYPHVRADIEERIHSIPIKEFTGIDHLPDNVEELVHTT